MFFVQNLKISANKFSLNYPVKIGRGIPQQKL